MSTFRTDALNPSSLPTAALGRPQRLHARSAADNAGPSGTTYKDSLAKAYNDYNVGIDREIKSLSSSLKELITLADVRVSHTRCVLSGLVLTTDWGKSSTARGSHSIIGSSTPYSTVDTRYPGVKRHIARAEAHASSIR